MSAERNVATDDAVERFFLLGRDIQHSFSPIIWAGVFAELGLAWSYGLRDVDEEQLPAVVEELKTEQYIGCNITMPYKQWAVALAEVKDQWVERAGVCNWLTWRDNQWHSTNTDAQGTAALFAETSTSDLTLLLGAGGASGAVLAALDGRTDHVVVASRTRSKSDLRAEHASAWISRAEAVDWDDRMEVARRADLIVNTTPIGMGGRPGSPLEDMEPQAGLRIMDAVYGQDLTDLEKQADTWNVEFSDGLAYLESQGTALLEHMGLSQAPVDVVQRHLAAAVGRSSRRWSRLDGDR